MRGACAGILLACVLASCGGGDAPATPSSLTPQQVQGLWVFARMGASACVPDTVNVRLTTAFYSIGVANQLSVSGDWTNNKDPRVRVFTGEVATSGGFLLHLTLNEGVRGTMDAGGRATGEAYCSDGSTASMTGVRK